jgi:hypothetical protein
MANNSWLAISKKVDLGREVQGTLPVSFLDPSIQEDVTDGYSLGSVTDGMSILEGKDASNQLAFYRLSPGPGVSIQQEGNSLQINSTVLAGNTPGVMLTSIYDTNDDGIVDHAALADSVRWTGIIGTPSTFAPAPHTHPIGQIIGLTDDLAALVPMTRMINTSFSIVGGGPLSSDLTIALIGDSSNPGPEMRYGTDATGNHGWYPASEGVGDMSTSVYDPNHNGYVNLAAAVIPGAITTAMLGVGAVTGTNIASQTIPGSALQNNAIATSLGYTPLNKAGDVATGQIAINMIGPNISSNMYQKAHLLAETNGTGAGYPTIALACLSAGANSGSVAMWYQGAHGDIQLQYGDGTAARLLSSISVVSGGQLTPGSIPASALASGAALANLGFTPVNGSSGGAYNLSGAISFQYNYGLAANSWAFAPIRVECPGGGGFRPQIGFYYPGVAASLYFEPVDQSMRFIDSGGNIRTLIDTGHGPGNIFNTLGYQPLNPSGGTMSGQLVAAFSTGVGPNSWASAPILIASSHNVNPTVRAGIGFNNQGLNAIYLYLDTDGKLRFMDNVGGVHLISST